MIQGKQMNTWETVIEYMNEHVGEIGSRQALIHHICNRRQVWRNGNQEPYRRFTTIDCYKNYLVQAGYIHKLKINGKLKQGRFFIPKEIPMGLTIAEVRNEAYGPKLMMMNTDMGSECLSAGHYYIGGTNGIQEYVLIDNTSYNSLHHNRQPKEPEFLSKDDMKI